jgi:hypothetical protein
MALLRRAPRQVYRVLSEQDYLAGESAEELTDPPAAAPRSARGRRRIAGVAAIAGAMILVTAEIVMRGPAHVNESQRQRQSHVQAPPARVLRRDGPSETRPRTVADVVRRFDPPSRRFALSHPSAAPGLPVTVAQRAAPPGEGAASPTPSEHAEFSFER